MSGIGRPLRIARGGRDGNRYTASMRRTGALMIAMSVLIGTTLGCDARDRPEAVWGAAGRGPGQFVYPRAIAIDPADGAFYVADRAGRITRMSRDGSFEREWQMPLWQRGKPVGLTVGPDGNLWVPDTHYSRVLVFTPTGEIIKEFGTFGEALGEFNLPTDVAFDSAGRIYVAEYGGNDRVTVFSPDLQPLYAIGREGRGQTDLARPQSLLILDDLLYIADACNHRISIWTLDGQHVRNIGQMGDGPGEMRFPYGVDVDPAGNLVVAEFGNNRVQKLDRVTGASLATWGLPGRGPGQFITPWGLVVDSGGRIVVVDGGNNRLQVMRF